MQLAVSALVGTSVCFSAASASTSKFSQCGLRIDGAAANRTSCAGLPNPTAQITIGPNNIEFASDDSGSSPERVAQINNDPATEFKCEFPGCE